MIRTGTVSIGAALGSALLAPIEPVTFQVLTVTFLVGGIALVATSRPCRCHQQHRAEPRPSADLFDPDGEGLDVLADEMPTVPLSLDQQAIAYTELRDQGAALYARSRAA